MDTRSLDRLDDEIAELSAHLDAVTARLLEILQAQHDAEGVGLNARTATPGWLGERLDVGWAIDVLHPLAR